MKKQLLIFFIALTSFFIIAEGFIRVTHIASVSSTEFYEDIGRGRRGNLDYVYFNEGLGVGRFNRFRYIGKAYPPSKSVNTIRVALLGDSFVESFQILERHHFGVIAERSLKMKYKRWDFEFLNFGRSGFDLSDMYVYEKTMVRKFDPDYILYFVSRSDLFPSSSDPLLPQLTVEMDGDLMVSYDFDHNILSRYEQTKLFTQNSALINMVVQGLKKCQDVPIWSILLGKWYGSAELGPAKEVLESSFLKSDSVDPIIKAIIEQADRDRLILINRDKERLPTEFEQLCDERGVRLFDLSQVLQTADLSGRSPYAWPALVGEGHWNQVGHELVGEEVAEIIAEVSHFLQPDTERSAKLRYYEE